MYALRFDFQVSNNEAKYEAILTGLLLEREVGAKDLSASSDSLLITILVNDTYEAKDQRMQRYLDTTRKLTHSFKSFKINHISQGKNKRANAVSKLASTSFDHFTKKVLVEVLMERNIDNRKIDSIAMPHDWTKPYLEYLLHDVLPDDRAISRKIKINAPQFSIREKQLYKRGYLALWLRCIAHAKGQ